MWIIAAATIGTISTVYSAYKNNKEEKEEIELKKRKKEFIKNLRKLGFSDKEIFIEYLMEFYWIYDTRNKAIYKLNEYDGVVAIRMDVESEEESEEELDKICKFEVHYTDYINNKEIYDKYITEGLYLKINKHLDKEHQIETIMDYIEYNLDKKPQTKTVNNIETNNYLEWAERYRGYIDIINNCYDEEIFYLYHIVSFEYENCEKEIKKLVIAKYMGRNGVMKI